MWIDEIGSGGKYRSVNQISEELSERIFLANLPVEWVCRRKIPDYGIDFEIELSEKFNNEKYILQGEMVWVQLKSVRKIKRNLTFDVERIFRHTFDSMTVFV